MSNNQENNSTENRRIRIMFLRNEKKQPVGSIAIDLVRGEKTATIFYQVSVVNPKDQFNRKFAHQIPKARLKKNPIHIHNIPNDIRIHGITETVMRDILDNPTHSKSPVLQRAAQLWIDAIPSKRNPSVAAE